jgi:hypothetical protein
MDELISDPKVVEAFINELYDRGFTEKQATILYRQWVNESLLDDNEHFRKGYTDVLREYAANKM